MDNPNFHFLSQLVEDIPDEMAKKPNQKSTKKDSKPS